MQRLLERLQLLRAVALVALDPREGFHVHRAGVVGQREGDEQRCVVLQRPRLHLEHLALEHHAPRVLGQLSDFDLGIGDRAAIKHLGRRGLLRGGGLGGGGQRGQPLFLLGLTLGDLAQTLLLVAARRHAHRAGHGELVLQYGREQPVHAAMPRKRRAHLVLKAQRQRAVLERPRGALERGDRAGRGLAQLARQKIAILRDVRVQRRAKRGIAQLERQIDAPKERAERILDFVIFALGHDAARVQKDDHRIARAAHLHLVQRQLLGQLAQLVRHGRFPRLFHRLSPLRPPRRGFSRFPSIQSSARRPPAGCLRGMGTRCCPVRG